MNPDLQKLQPVDVLQVDPVPQLHKEVQFNPHLPVIHATEIKIQYSFRKLIKIDTYVLLNYKLLFDIVPSTDRCNCLDELNTE